MGLKNTGNLQEKESLIKEGYKVIAENPSGWLLYKKEEVTVPEQPKATSNVDKGKGKGKGKKGKGK